VFIDESNGAPEPFNKQHRLTQGLNQALFLYPGGIAKDEDSKLKFEQLVQTGVGNSGTVPAMALQRFDQERAGANRNLFQHTRTKDGYILAAQITGTPPEDDAALAALAADDENDPADSPEAKKKAAGADAKPMKAILVSDIDWIIPSFFFIREGGDETFLPATQNVPLILNVIDTLAGDERFVEIRKRARIHRTLEKIDEATRAHRERAAEEREKFVKDIEDRENAAREAMQKKIDEVESSNLATLEKEVLLEQTRLREQKKLDAEIRALADERRLQTKKIKYEMDQEVRAVQDRYKRYAILIPPIPPLLLALAVFFRRRELERQGVSRERLR
jgi:ABC-2 type transport system permease protein